MDGLTIAALIIVIVLGGGLFILFVVVHNSNSSALQAIDLSKTGKSQWFRELKTNGRITTDPKEMDKNGIRIILESGKNTHAFVIIKDEEVGLITYDIETKHQAKGNVLEPELSTFETADIHYKYHPSEYVYTGVTVGGITTGGVTNVGNYYTQSMTDNGGYAIACKHNLEYSELVGAYKDKTKFVVSGMYVSSSLISSAKRNPTLAQLKKDKDNYFVFFHPTKMPKEYLDVMDKADFSTQQELLNKSKRNAYLTKEECQDIISWIRYNKG